MDEFTDITKIENIPTGDFRDRLPDEFIITVSNDEGKVVQELRYEERPSNELVKRISTNLFDAWGTDHYVWLNWSLEWEGS